MIALDLAAKLTPLVQDWMTTTKQGKGGMGVGEANHSIQESKDWWQKGPQDLI